jgi:hypothetical protein
MTNRTAFVTTIFVLLSASVTTIAFQFRHTSSDTHSDNQSLVERLLGLIGVEVIPDERVPVIKLDAESIAFALSLYFKEFNKYPQSGNAEIARALTGDNPAKKVFIEFGKSNEKHEFLDPWRTPYEIRLSPSGNFLLRSAGSNGLLGDEDDKVYKSNLQQRGKRTSEL